MPTTDTLGKEPNQPILELPRESPPATSPFFWKVFFPLLPCSFHLLFPTQSFSTHSLPPSVSPLSPHSSPHLSLFLSFLPFTSPLLFDNTVPVLSLSWPFFYIPVSEMSSCGFAGPLLQPLKLLKAVSPPNALPHREGPREQTQKRGSSSLGVPRGMRCSAP